MRKGILGGTFDPVHNGHIAVAREALTVLHLNEVVFLPAGKPWLKSDRNITAPQDRLNMLKLAIEGERRFTISTMELNRVGNTYTIDTVEGIKDSLGQGDELYFIIGCDKLSELPLWKDVRRLVKLCRLAAVPRPGCRPPDMVKLEKEIPEISQRLALLEGPLVDISATEIRRRVAEGLGIEGMVPAAVECYIRRHSLYIEPVRKE